jgi:putative ATP-dependent endonuclease of OLD family
MRISYVRIENFRNFKLLEVELGQNAVLVGENKAGKTNFVEALRLVLDPTLSEADRQLTAQDFWDGDGEEPFNGREIKITVQFTDVAEEGSPEYIPLSWLSDCLVQHSPKRVAQLTYWYHEDKEPTANDTDNNDETSVSSEPNRGETESTNKSDQEDYKFEIYPGDKPGERFNIRGMRRDIPLYFIKAIRDIATDSNVWQRSPLNRLIKLTELTAEQFEPYAHRMRDVSDDVVTDLAPLDTLNDEIQSELEDMIGSLYTVDPQLGLNATTPETLLEAMRLYVDGPQRRSLDRTSLGIQNALYMALLSLFLQKQEVRRNVKNEPFIPIIALEEPEAHLHPNLQRLVFKYSLQKASERKQPVLITTHSPYLAITADLRDLVLLKDHGDQGCKAKSAYSFAQSLDPRVRQDLERFLDITKAEMLFCRGVIFVEGDVEVLLVREFARILQIPLEKYGIAVCNTYGASFVHVITLAHVFGVPFLVLTDGDKHISPTGLERGVDLLEVVNPCQKIRLQLLYAGGRKESVRRWLKKEGVFVNDWTLEVSLLEVGLGEELKQTFVDLGNELGINVRAGPGYIEAYLLDPDNEDNVHSILTSIDDKRWHKGRFAHRLIPHLRNKAASMSSLSEREAIVPSYIEEGIKYLVNRVQFERPGM